MQILKSEQYVEPWRPPPWLNILTYSGLFIKEHFKYLRKNIANDL